METLIVKIKNQNKVAFTKELLKSFNFLDVKEEANKTVKKGISKKRKDSLIQGFKEMKLVETKKLKAKSATALLKELENG
jgi:hypothetical protein